MCKQRLLTSILGCALLTAIPAMGASDENGNFIYVMGIDGNWTPPSVEQEGAFEFYQSRKLYETAPGSNIYAGSVQADMSQPVWFRFTTSLDTPLEDCWTINNIGPISPEANTQPMRIAGTSGIRSASCILNTDPEVLVGSWHLPGSVISGSDPCLRVDLNTDKVYIFGQNDAAAIIDYNGDFSWDNIDSYVYAGNTSIPSLQFLSPGKHTITFLRYSDEAIFGAGDNQILSTITDLNNSYTTAENAQPFSIEESWIGGAVRTKFINDTEAFIGFLTSLPPILSPQSNLSIVGAFNDWNVENGTPLTQTDSEGYCFSGVTPPDQFKIVADNSWALSYGAYQHYDHDADGFLVVEISSDLYATNLEIAAPEGTPFALDLKKRTITFQSTEATLSYPDFLTVGIPDEDALPEVPDNLIYLHREGDALLPTTGNLPYIYTLLTYAEAGKDLNAYFLQAFGYNFITKVGDTPQAATVAAPADGYVNLYRGMFDEQGNTSVKLAEFPISEAGYIYDDIGNNTFSFSFNAEELPAEASVHCANYSIPTQFYLVGTPNNWDIMHSDYVLPRGEDGSYTGTFEIGEYPYFRFYSELGDWDSNSIGASYIDENYMEELPYYGYAYAGKGNWVLPNWPGGFITFTLRPQDEFWYLEMRAADSGVDTTVEDSPLTLTGGKGCITVSASAPATVEICDFAGRLAGRHSVAAGCSSIPLQPGLYIANGQKILVK